MLCLGRGFFPRAIHDANTFRPPQLVVGRLPPSAAGRYCQWVEVAWELLFDRPPQLPEASRSRTIGDCWVHEPRTSRTTTVATTLRSTSRAAVPLRAGRRRGACSHVVPCRGLPFSDLAVCEVRGLGPVCACLVPLDHERGQFTHQDMVGGRLGHVSAK